jgi:hypothetical protein
MPQRHVVKPERNPDGFTIHFRNVAKSPRNRGEQEGIQSRFVRVTWSSRRSCSRMKRSASAASPGRMERTVKEGIGASQGPAGRSPKTAWKEGRGSSVHGSRRSKKWLPAIAHKLVDEKASAAMLHCGSGPIGQVPSSSAPLPQAPSNPRPCWQPHDLESRPSMCNRRSDPCAQEPWRCYLQSIP